MNTTLLPVQYCHSIHYNGINSKLTGNRMTLRIEQTDERCFLVTKAVCSTLDQFRRDSGRSKADFRKYIHGECIAHSGAYHIRTTSNYISVVKLPDGGTKSVPLTIKCYFHPKNGEIAYEIMVFGQSEVTQKDMLEAILTAFKLGNFYE